MVVWGIIAVLTAGVAFLVMRPYWLLNKEPDNTAPSNTPPLQVEIYKQQLREIDEERAAGQINDTEAEAARIEVSRRILAADKNTKQSAEKASVSLPQRQQAFTALTIVVLAVVSVGTYLVLGSPGLTSQSSETQQQSQASRVRKMIEQVEERLRQNPDEGAGWEVIAPVYMRMGRFDDAVNAYTKAMEKLGETSDRLANLGEALTYANKGVISPEARKRLQKAAKIQPNHPKAEFWLGVADEQAGNLAAALDRYKSLLKGNMPDEVKKVIRERVKNVSAMLAKPNAAKDGNPQAAQGEGASPGSGVSSLSDSERTMIDGMVKRLATRLEQDGSDLEGWFKLIKSYMVLKRRDDALSAVKQARKQFKSNAEALEQIDTTARSLGLTP
jgi:cytochrome c-type biogenesis protein CcmH